MLNIRTIALVGNPNSGKTTLFNQLTGSNQRVGNWPGVTVERKEGIFNTYKNRISIIDLPGVYSLTTVSQHSSSLEEQITCRYVMEQQADMFINVVNAANLERNLYLTLQLLESGVPCIIALNMLDIAYSQGINIDIVTLKKRLDCPIIPLISTRAESIEILKSEISSLLPEKSSFNIDYPPIIQKAIKNLESRIPNYYMPRQKSWMALRMLEGDIHSRDLLSTQQKLHNFYIDNQKDDIALLIANTRYTTIANLCQSVSNSHLIPANCLTKKLDALLLNRWLGVPIFFILIYLVFILAINIGNILQPILDIGSTALFIDGIQWIGCQLSVSQWIVLFLAQGLGGGINTIIPLIPQIGIIYLCLSFLEDSGYMARAAFVMDRLMQFLGLPGKSFVPLIIGFGCNVPSIMGARILNTTRERIITIMMAPFISCGARLAIFVVFAAAFFGRYSATLVFSLYILGIIVAVLTGWILKYILICDETIPFIMELPVYHVPHIKSLLFQTWQLLKNFILRTSKIIILASIFISILNCFTLRGHLAEDVNHSALAIISKTLTPLLKPIGVHEDNWQATISLISGSMAKEVVISTLNTLYTAEKIFITPFNPETFNVLNKLKIAVNQTRKELYNIFNINVFINFIGYNYNYIDITSDTKTIIYNKFGSAIAAYSYLIFVLLYVPCISVLGTITRESSRTWMLLSILWGLNIAYSMATLFYQIATFANHPRYSTISIVTVTIINSLIFYYLYYRREQFKSILNYSIDITDRPF